ncbi:uncharacterized protein LOC119402877 [Rhipicephalus sanguineus]|uniref:uncharacterized protein LOC119402877 n=1 Tax=Rhipicephalus sanguineus TaxID=34632 RepID=UPI0018960966|nr:uncharacterized protein LOC119402877 [Rhipicephalus sanguineus]
MRTVLFFIIKWLLFCTVMSNRRRNQNLCGHKAMDGWKFFAENMTYVLWKRNYHVSGGLNNTMCVKAPFQPTLYRQTHKIQKTFTYRNMSSTHKLPNGASYWPIAKILLQFRSTTPYLSRPPQRRRNDYNYVNSTILMSWFGYYLPPPSWLFMYCDKDCAVVKVLPKEVYDEDSSRSQKHKCEQWVRVAAKNNKAIKKSARWRRCESFYDTVCGTEISEQVYNPKLCGW